MLQSTTPLSKIRPVNPEQDSLVKIKLLIESTNRSPAKRSDFILIRVAIYCTFHHHLLKIFDVIDVVIVGNTGLGLMCFI
jgi:hypothetical protein